MSTEHLMGVYNRAPLEVERGRGARLWATDGTEYLDCVAGISTNVLCYAHPELFQAVKDQAEKLWHVSNIFRIPGQEALADALDQQAHGLAGPLFGYLLHVGRRFTPERLAIQRQRCDLREPCLRVPMVIEGEVDGLLRG